MTKAAFPSLGLRRTPVPPESAPYVIVAMHTPPYREKADRLFASCIRHGLPLALYEVPAVHRSISLNGVDDLSLTKCAFIESALEEHGKPVLYVDSDVIFHDRPVHLETLIPEVDFAVYNWMADAWNDVWEPVSVRPSHGEISHTRFWAFHYAIHYHDPSQLICSGMTQLWAPSKAALDLLKDWQATIAAYPGVSDDECLDYTFNTRDNTALRYAWLGKDYVRMPGWPHVRPVVAHPDPVNAETLFVPIADILKRQRFDASRAPATPRPPEAFPRDVILDVQGKAIFRVVGNSLQREGSLEAQFWL